MSERQPGALAFVVRIRRRAARDGGWIGRVTHLSSGASRSFARFDELVRFLYDEVEKPESAEPVNAVGKSQ